MKRIPLALTLIVIVLLMIVLAASTPSIAAQDATLEAAPVATVEPLPVEIIDGEGETAGMSPLLQIALSVSAVIVALSFAFEKIGNRAKAANANPFETAALEKLGDGVPSAVVIGLTGVFERTIISMENMLQTWREATDKIPASTKPIEPRPAVQSTPSQDSM